ncbi:MAG: hypothetical protein JSS60_08290 [Verrucomicrobia bacterium]|nr:hypothetical protein [Verrucomicrobiota bacterium]
MTVDPQTNLQNYIDQWQQANAQYTSDYSYLIQMIQQMVALAKEGGSGVEEAYQLGEQCVMPGAMTVQGDTMGQLAASMNVGSALQQFTTDSQNDMNAAGTMTTDQAQQFVKYITETYDDIQAELKLPANQQWLDSTTANNILQSLCKVTQEFGFNDPDSMSENPDAPAVIQTSLNNWANNPTSLYGVNTGQQHMQNLQSSFTQWNNSESAQSQSLTAQEQFASNTYNQYMNSCTDVFQSTQQFVQNIVQHEIAN